MARKSILPGFGGKDVLEMSLPDNNVQEYDFSPCATGAITLTDIGGSDGSIDVEQSFDGVNWELVDTLTVAGDQVIFQHLQPIGLIRLTLTDTSSSPASVSSSASPESDSTADATATVTVVGFKLPVGA